MKKPTYIKHSNLPPQGTFMEPLVYWMLLEHFNAPGWGYGVVFTLIFVKTLVNLYRAFTGEAVDILKGEK